jgi:hypothetical protein
MRFDDLLASEDVYPSGPCESRREWLLTYFSGVPSNEIASWCRVAPARVRRTVEKQIRHSPSWFDQCLRIHDQPADRREKFNRPTREGLWWKHYNDVAAHITKHGILPSQNHGDHARVLYRWIEASAGRTTPATLPRTSSMPLTSWAHGKADDAAAPTSTGPDASRSCACSRTPMDGCQCMTRYAGRRSDCSRYGSDVRERGRGKGA